MERMPLSKSIPEDIREILNAIMDEVAGEIIQLEAAPTTAGGELKPGQVGIFGNDLFMNIEGRTIKFVGALV